MQRKVEKCIPNMLFLLLSVLFVLSSSGGWTELLSHWLNCTVQTPLCTQGSGLSFPLLALAVLYKLSHPSSVCSVPLCLFLRGESIYSAHFYLSGEANFLFSFWLLTSVILTPPLSTEGRLNPPQVSYLPTSTYLVRNMRATQASRNTPFKGCLF